ncbi:preprotein translocase subunit SecA, partial [Candidatus Azambacteria bacterium RIFCSPHIGHO2_02_FULL_45_18]
QNSKTDKLDELRDITGGFKVVHEFLRPVSKKEAYACDIVYGTNTEFGFDYLRDNLVQSFDQMVSPKRNYAIVDEVDSILIDEARTPLIISVPDSESPKLYESFARIAPRLQENVDYNVDEKMRTAIITEEGLSKVERILGIGNIYNEQGVKYVHHLENALKAQALFHKDKEYVVKDGQVIIVDEFTGRMLQGRRYSEGLHQAIEAKEGVKVERESRTLATITFQNFFRLYSKLAGMTGTAATSAEELHKVYGLDVAIIPTHKPMVRRDLADQIYKNEDVKFRAVARDIKERNEKGQPVLVGTISIENNEKLSRLLLREGIAHEMLNAKQHEREGSIIAQAGKPRAVTIATNMAGRGVDIILGGNPPTPEEAETVRKAGGLHVIGTERHEARRIDNQLRGRAGRQGDPGSSQFYVSLGDHLMRVFGGDRIRGLMERLNMPEDQPIENSFISKALESAQSKIEGLNFDARKHLLEYDDVMNKHRTAIYKKRLDILSGHVHKGSAFDLLKKTVKAIFDFHVQSDQFWSDWLREEVFENLKAFLPIGQEQKEFLAKAATRDEVENYFLEVVIKIYEEKEKRVGARVMREIERMVMLNSLDNLWMNHLEDMEHLRDSVRLRAYGQRDPLVEYKNEAHGLFNSLLRNFEEQVAMMILKVEPLNVTPVGEPTAPPARNLNAEPETKVPASKVSPKGREVGRNDPCWCGSGKKFKKCHGK